MCVACSKYGLRPHVDGVQGKEILKSYLLSEHASSSSSPLGNIGNEEIKFGLLVTCK